ncbi:hypothetical protein MTO96_020016 [Rhipicephalus appendiculatus]
MGYSRILFFVMQFLSMLVGQPDGSALQRNDGTTAYASAPETTAYLPADPLKRMDFIQVERCWPADLLSSDCAGATSTESPTSLIKPTATQNFQNFFSGLGRTNRMGYLRTLFFVMQVNRFG